MTPSCTINGLSNNTVYTFTVTATTADGTSVSSIASAAVTPLAGTENINLIGNYCSIKWNSGYISKLSSDVANTFPQGIFATLSEPLDTVLSATDVNNNANSSLDCKNAWSPVQIFCDQPGGKDNLTQVYKNNTMSVLDRKAKKTANGKRPPNLLRRPLSIY